MNIISNVRVNAHEDTFNIDVDDLTEESPKEDHPEGIGIRLKSHQLTLLRRCIKYENEKLLLGSFPSLVDRVTPTEHLTTNIGIIGDRVGSGKSYVVLSLIKCNNIVSHKKTTIRSTALNNVAFYLQNTCDVFKASLIVIPFSLCTQWEGYIKMFKGDLTYKIINKSKTLTEMVGRVKDIVEGTDIILVTSTFYNKFADMIKREKIKFQRIFYDEADTIHINNCCQLDANFYWFVTASYGNLLYPKGFAKQERTLNRYIWCADGLKNTGFIKNVFIDMHYSIPHVLIKTLVVKNSEAYVQHSIELPPINTFVVICKTPQSITVLNGIVDKNIISCLNAGDVQRALQFVNPSQKMSEDNIIAVIVDKYTKQLGNIEVRKSILDQLHFDDEAERVRELQSLQVRESELKKNIALIKERIESANMCYICYEEHENKTIVNCCQNSFCFKCINMWLSRKAMCPLCKAKLSSDSLFILSNEKPNKVAEQEAIVEDTIIGGIKGFNRQNEKIKNMSVLLNGKKTAKILIFSSYDSSLDKIIPILEASTIKYEYVKGNGNHINSVIEKYRNGDVNVLLVNSRYYGSGFNMENTTDIIMFHKFETEIEKQVIGRAQRLGRTTPLNVWYLLHDNE